MARRPRDTTPGRRGSGDGRGRRKATTEGGRLDVPRGAREPIGKERARSRSDAPPRPKREAAAPARPPLPDDEEPDLPRAVRREIERAVGPRRSRDVALALSIGAAAIDEERPDVALEVLAWAKHEAPRVGSIREAYGVALYLSEDWAAALTELQAYRRLTGRVDQNHLVADCLRALGRGVDRIAETAQELVEDMRAPADRRAEACIVWAAALADAGDIATGRAILRRFLEQPRDGDEDHDLRVRYLAADLAERDGARDEAVGQLELIAAAQPDYLDVADRLERLDAQS